MARARVTYLTEEDRRFIHEQVAFLLEEVGVGYNSVAAIDVLEEAGAPVDRERLRARLPWDLMERCLKTCPRQVRLAGRVRGRTSCWATARLRSAPTAPARTSTTTRAGCAPRGARPHSAR